MCRLNLNLMPPIVDYSEKKKFISFAKKKKTKMYAIVSDLSARTQKALQFILQERARLDLHCAVSTRENNSKSYIYAKHEQK